MRNREEAARAAEATTRNTPGMCQAQVVVWFQSSPVGDYDGDGAADAEDGWKSEPAKYKHTGDRRPPRGVPVSFLGGSHDNGHRAMSLGAGKFRSTDFDTATQRYAPGHVGTANSLEVLERVMGVTYAGWSETMDGKYIPLPLGHRRRSKGWRVEKAERLLHHAGRQPGTLRASILEKVAKLLARVPEHPKH